jgi:hypothetical protein
MVHQAFLKQLQLFYLAISLILLININFNMMIFLLLSKFQEYFISATLHKKFNQGC